MRSGIAYVAISLITISMGYAHEWTDNSGQFHTEAKLLGRDGKAIWLKKTNGRIVRVEIDRLSTSDHAFIQQELATDPICPVAPKLDPKAINALESDQATKGLFRLASAQIPESTQATEKEVDDHGWRWKYLYSGCLLQAQLIIGKSPPPPGVGTVTYWHDGFHRLDGLEFFFSVPDWYHYRVTFPGDGYKYWSFGRVSNCCGSYPVWAWDQAMKPHFKGWFWRERVW